MKTNKFFFTIIILIVLALFIAFYFQQKNDFDKSAFYGDKVFDICGEDLKTYKGCEKFCEDLTGINCKSVHSKAQEIKKGVCYYYHPQIWEGDPCAHCEVICEPL